MAIHHIWLSANPELRPHLRRAAEARAATFHAAWRATVRALGAPIRRLGAALRARRTHAALSDLSDRQLADIGLHRGEIASVARAVADQPPGGSVALADLPRLREAGARPRAGGRGDRPAPRAARRAAAHGQHRRAA